MSDQHRSSPATRLVGMGRPDRSPGAAVGPGIELSSTYVAGGTPAYGRFSNRTWEVLEDTLGDLEGGRALSFASGMAAVSACLALTPPGGTVVLPHHSYNGTGALVDLLERRGALRAVRVDPADTAAVLAALPSADVLWIESPTNPMLEIADLPTLFAAAGKAGVRTVVDNTFNTPLLLQPLQLGADVVLHSVTKYLAGHSDVVLGATITADEQLYATLLTHRTLHGAIPGPHEAWLALRGMRTLHLRLERACENAVELARRLKEHPAVARVRYPGRGAIVCLETVGGQAAAEALEQRVQVWLPATSLGGVESTLERRRRHAAEPESVPVELVRLSVGIEAVEDLWADIDQALRG
ncbi:trans-sulfuration enzyme family protein [Rudaeicoccus suwonensis]|uniref:homocysteine desulfhydrase n=1 Tax=Rudaeicoccus suwonensis TaxID=657409 RepID=A0A561E9D4_9MICO|nr:PLP-dependent aspartate aminotransferase family protein [Rudaeicoccus suwonensis]TWE12223.1 cystathionine gamma-synthase [Rudaeicoccus suwonensis]